jgi:putative endonuclease
MKMMCSKRKNPTRASTTKALGDQAESQSLHQLVEAGLTLLARNYRSPGRGGGEIDLIMREPDGTVVFVEVRSRQAVDFGGAAASVGRQKQRRIIFTARHFLSRLLVWPPCRFDVMAQEAGEWTWLKGAFDAGR